MAYLDGVLYIPFQCGNSCGHFDSTPCEGCTLYGIAWRCSRSFCIRRTGKSCFFGTDLIMDSSGEGTQGSRGFSQVGLFFLCSAAGLCIWASG
jgi:hypothetical protein